MTTAPPVDGRRPPRRHPADLHGGLDRAHPGFRLPHRSPLGPRPRLTRRSWRGFRAFGEELRRRRQPLLARSHRAGLHRPRLGCGAGTDLLIAAADGWRGGPRHRHRHDGDHAGAGASERRGDGTRQRRATRRPHRVRAVVDASVDVVISNGVIDLVPDKERSSTRLIGPPPRRAAAGRRCRHPQGSFRGRAQEHRPLDRLNRRSSPGRRARATVGRTRYTDIKQGDLIDTYARSKFEDTRRKAEKYGAMGSTIRATKPPR